MYLLLPGIRMNAISKEHSPYPGYFRFGGTNNYTQLATISEWLIITQHSPLMRQLCHFTSPSHSTISSTFTRPSALVSMSAGIASVRR